MIEVIIQNYITICISVESSSLKLCEYSVPKTRDFLKINYVTVSLVIDRIGQYDLNKYYKLRIPTFILSLW